MYIQIIFFARQIINNRRKNETIIAAVAPSIIFIHFYRVQRYRTKL